MNIPFFIYVIIATAIVCFLYRNKLSPPLSGGMLAFLIFTIVVEIIGCEMRARSMRNHWLYNIFIIVEFYFWLYVYHQVLQDKRIKKAINWFSVFFAIFILYNLLFLQGVYFFNTYTYMLGGIAILSLTALYFRQLFISDLELNLKRDVLFWISTGLLFYYLGNIPIDGMLNYLNVYNKAIVVKYFPVISSILIITKHVSLIIGFICTPRIQKLK